MSNRQLSPWGEIAFISDVYEHQINRQLCLRLEKKDKEVVSYFGTDEDDIIVSRFVIGSSQHLYLEPGLPDLPIVIKPSTDLKLLPGCTMNAFINIPMVLQLKFGSSKKKILLQEFPLKSLSKSWFGDPESGEIAYFLESSLQDTPGSCSEEINGIHCPVSVINKTNQVLPLERMMLRVPYLTIYKGEKKYYSNTTKIAYKGQDQISQINIIKVPPDIEQNLALISSPRLAIDSGLLKKSFYFIKTLYEG